MLWAQPVLNAPHCPLIYLTLAKLTYEDVMGGGVNQSTWMQTSHRKGRLQIRLFDRSCWTGNLHYLPVPQTERYWPLTYQWHLQIKPNVNVILTGIEPCSIFNEKSKYPVRENSGFYTAWIQQTPGQGTPFPNSLVSQVQHLKRNKQKNYISLDYFFSFFLSKHQSVFRFMKGCTNSGFNWISELAKRMIVLFKLKNWNWQFLPPLYYKGWFYGIAKLCVFFDFDTCVKNWKPVCRSLQVKRCPPPSQGPPTAQAAGRHAWRAAHRSPDQELNVGEIPRPEVKLHAAQRFGFSKNKSTAWSCKSPPRLLNHSITDH